MKAAAWLLVFAGLLCGPGYWFYAEAVSGEAAGTYRGASFTLRLDPGMNPVGFLVSPPDNDTPQDRRYTASLTIDGFPAMERSFVVPGVEPSGRVSRSPATSVVLGSFRVPDAGEYRLTITAQGAGAQHASQALQGMTTEVRRNLVTPDMRVVWAGVGSMALGLLIVLLRRHGEPRGG
ncbi:MAG: hypothetical protein IT514_10600 [Burkholderiales bacterium]|nr:hypothetical protein [Burkholderiales bacterium]